MDFEQKPIQQEYIYKGVVFNTRKDICTLPNGKTAPREVVEHRGGVGIALQSKDGRFYLVQQWRYAQECLTWEYPAGKKEKGEDPLTTAKREIQEETGYEGTDFQYLGKIYPTPAYDTEVIDFYYAKEGDYVGQNLDPDEFLVLKKFTLAEINTMILDGEIPDAKTVAMTYYLNNLNV